MNLQDSSPFGRGTFSVRKRAFAVLGVATLITCAGWLNLVRRGELPLDEAMFYIAWGCGTYAVCAVIWLTRKSDAAQIGGFIVSVFLFIATLICSGPPLVGDAKPDGYFSLFFIVWMWGTLIVASIVALLISFTHRAR